MLRDLDQYNIITKELRYLVLFQDWPVFWKQLLLDSVWKSLSAIQYVILYLAVLFLVNAKKENIKKKVCFIYNGQTS